MVGVDPSGYSENYWWHLGKTLTSVGNGILEYGNVVKDSADILVVDPAKDTIDQWNNAMAYDGEYQTLGRVLGGFGSIANITGGGLEVLTPQILGIRIAIRTPIRILAGGNNEDARVMIGIADSIASFASFRNAGKTLTKAGSIITKSKKALRKFLKKSKNQKKWGKTNSAARSKAYTDVIGYFNSLFSTASTIAGIPDDPIVP